MACYGYKNHETGETFDIHLPMSADKPAAIVMVAGEWEEVDPDSPGAFVREFAFAGAIRGHQAGIIREKGPPVSRALPPKMRKPGDGSEVKKVGKHSIVKHRDGTRTDMTGKRIIENKQDRARASDQTGMKYDKNL